MKGNIYFSAKDVRADRLGATTLLNNTWYTKPALIPAMPALDSRPPLPAHAVHASRTADGVQLKWSRTSNDTTSYAIYRRELLGNDHCPDNDARNLLATLRSTGATQSYVDPTATPGKAYIYTVTTLDRLSNQSTGIPAVSLR